MFRFLIFLFSLFGLSASLSGQCPDKDAVLKLIYADSSDEAGKFPQLLQYISAARRCSIKSDTLFGMMLQKAARVFAAQNNYSRAVNCLNEAIPVFRESGSSPEAIDGYISQCYYLLNFLYADIGLRERYIQSIDSCIAAEKRMNSNYKYTLFFIEDKLKWYYTTGDYKLCLLYADMSETMIRQHASSRDTLRLLMNVWFNKAQCLVRLGDPDAARRLLDEYVRPNIKAGRQVNLGAMYGFYALVSKYQGKYQEEMFYDWQSYQLNRRIKYRKGCAESLISISSTLFERFGKGDSAAHCLKLALTFADRIDSVYIFNLLANLHVKKYDFKTAFQYFHRAFDCISPGMDENQIDSMTAYQLVNTHLNVYIIRLVTDKASANLEAYKLRGSQGYLNRAINISRHANAFMSRLKNDILEVESNLSWRTKTTRLYETAIEACLLANKPHEAFYFFEESRSVLLDDKIGRYRGLSDNEIVYQADLETRKNQLQQQLYAMEAGSVKATEVQQKIYEVSQLQEHFMKQTAKATQKLAQGFRTLEDFRAKGLRHHRALVEYFIGDSAVYSLTVLPDTVSITRINKLNYDELTLTYLSLVAKPVIYERDHLAFIRTAQKLYDLLFATTPLPTGRILISPDGRYFPFEALIKNSEPGKTRYLLEDNIISYVYSAGYLSASDPAITSAAPLFMGMAPVSFKSSSQMVTLTGSGQSLVNIAANFDSPDYYLQHKASRKNFLANFGKYQVTHLYTHAAANLSSGEPVLYFSDSAIQLNNIVVRERPATTLIVLAACESGLGKAFAGEGVFSFNRAFAGVGVPAALVNLWSVENKTTYRLNELFYRYVAKGLPFDVALQQAKLNYLQTATGAEKAPYHWAAGILTGRPLAIYGRRYMFISVIIAISVVLFFSGAIWWTRTAGFGRD